MNEHEDNKYFRAQERVQEIKSFYSKLIRSFLFVAFLAALNYYTNEWRYMWFLWAALGIGLGVTSNAVKVFGMNPFFGKNWESRKIKEIMKDEQQQKWN